MAREKECTMQQIIEKLGISRWSIYRAVKNGDLKVDRKEGHELVFKVSEVEKYLNRKN